MNGGSLVFDSSVSGNAFTLGGLAASTSGTGYNIALQNNAGTPAAIALTVGGDNANTTYAGVLSAGGSLIKTGTGTWTLSGANSYSGATQVNAGTLSINTVATGATAQSLGKDTASSAVTLGGSGTSGTLLYTGGAGTLDKNIASLGTGTGGASDTIQNSGTGLLTLSGGLVKNGTKLTLNGGANGINVTTTAISGSAANSDLLVTGARRRSPWPQLITVHDGLRRRHAGQRRQ